MKMDNLKFIIKIEFSWDMQMAMYPYGNILNYLGSDLCMIHAKIGKSTGANLSAIQVKKALKWDKTTFSTSSLGKVEEIPRLVPLPVKWLLEKFKDIVLDKLIKCLLPKQIIDHETKLPTWVPYKMFQA